MISKVFITGTDTGVGKTWVSAAAIRSLLQRGISAKALKPIACGLDEAGRNEDIEALLSAQSLMNANTINRYRFALPAAPSQAGSEQGQSIEPGTLVHWCDEKADAVDCCMIEGVGGLMTPLTDSWLISDWIEAMPDCEVWLVVGCKLGAINQTLLTLAKLKQMNRSPTRIFFNAANAEDNAWIDSTRLAVEPFLHADCVVSSIHFGEQPDMLGGS